MGAANSTQTLEKYELEGTYPKIDSDGRVTIDIEYYQLQQDFDYSLLDDHDYLIFNQKPSNNFTLKYGKDSKEMINLSSVYGYPNTLRLVKTQRLRDDILSTKAPYVVSQEF